MQCIFSEQSKPPSCDNGPIVSVYLKLELLHEIIDQEAIQHNTVQVSQDSHFQRKNELPQAGLEVMTFCILGRCSGVLRTPS